MLNYKIQYYTVKYPLTVNSLVICCKIAVIPVVISMHKNYYMGVIFGWKFYKHHTVKFLKAFASVFPPLYDLADVTKLLFCCMWTNIIIIAVLSHHCYVWLSWIMLVVEYTDLRNIIWCKQMEGKDASEEADRSYVSVFSACLPMIQDVLFL